MKQFRKFVPFSKLFKDAANYESVSGQALGDYCFQKLAKMRRLDIRTGQVLDRRGNWRDYRRVPKMVRATQHQDANTFYTYICRRWEIFQKVKSRQGPNRSKGTFRLNNSNQPQSVKKRNAQSTGNESATKAERTKITYYNCGMTGHIAKKCHKPRIECHKCRRLGTQSKNVPLSKA